MSNQQPDSSQQCRILAVDDESEVRNAYAQSLTFDSDEIDTEIQNAFSTIIDSPPTKTPPLNGFDLSLADQGNSAITMAKRALAEGCYVPLYMSHFVSTYLRW
ncbi:MAG: hypothetical protein HN382_11755, partial [Gammaproteobacteria bacterium]|nr:hypothetical protein [Gammaproteobacteria bacterium]